MILPTRNITLEVGRWAAVFDPYQATLMGQQLDARGIDVEAFNFTPASVSQLALTLHQLIRNHDIELPPKPDLIDELANVRLIETSPSVYRLDHDAGQHDDRAIAVGIAAHRLIHKEGPLRPRRVV